MGEKKKPAELIKRYVFLCIGLIIMSFGIGFSIKAGLGTSPISSLPYVGSLLIPITVGQLTIIMHCVFILLQILILRRKYHIVQLMQLPVAFLFGYLTDFALELMKNVTYSGYVSQWELCIAGIILVGIGVSIEVTANVVTLAGEGIILAICEVVPVKFGNMKIIFDVSLVTISCILSLCFLGRLEGVREGTIAAAILVGLIAKVINKPMKKIEKVFIC